MIPYTLHTMTQEDVDAVTEVLWRGPLTGNGPKVEELERRWAELVGAKYAVAVSSGTTALEFAYGALHVTRERRVCVPPITFVATASAAKRQGAEILWCDVDPLTGCADLETVPSTDLLALVTLGGQFPWTDADLEHLRHRGMVLLVDACHGPYRHHDLAAATVFSLHPAKHVAAGEGGIIATNQREVATYVKLLRDAGRLAYGDQYGHRAQTILGHNGRLSEIHAALACSQLDRLEEGIAIRRQLAATYDTAGWGVEIVPHGPESARHLYQILVDDRDKVREHLLAHGIGTAVCYRPVCDEPYWRHLREWDVPNARLHASRTLALPLFPDLSAVQQEKVITALRTSL